MMFRQLFFVSSCLVRWIKLRQATGSHLHVDIVSILVFSFFFTGSQEIHLQRCSYSLSFRK